jgi:hypothetical protein
MRLCIGIHTKGTSAFISSIRFCAIADPADIQWQTPLKHGLSVDKPQAAGM